MFRSKKPIEKVAPWPENSLEKVAQQGAGTWAGRQCAGLKAQSRRCWFAGIRLARGLVFSTEKRCAWISLGCQARRHVPTAPNPRARCRPHVVAGAAGPPGSVLDTTKSLKPCTISPGRGPNPQGVVLSRPAACGGARDGRCMPPQLRAWQKPVLSFFGRKDKRNLFSDILVLQLWQ